MFRFVFVCTLVDGGVFWVCSGNVCIGGWARGEPCDVQIRFASLVISILSYIFICICICFCIFTEGWAEGSLVTYQSRFDLLIISICSYIFVCICIFVYLYLYLYLRLYKKMHGPKARQVTPLKLFCLSLTPTLDDPRY